MANYSDELVEPVEDDNISQLEVFAHNYKIGQEAVRELEILKPVLAEAINRLPKKQLKLTLTEQAELGKVAVQLKQEKSGAIVFRAVKA